MHGDVVDELKRLNATEIDRPAFAGSTLAREQLNSHGAAMAGALSVLKINLTSGGHDVVNHLNVVRSDVQTVAAIGARGGAGDGDRAAEYSTDELADFSSVQIDRRVKLQNAALWDAGDDHTAVAGRILRV